jgi:hypothetical protein
MRILDSISPDEVIGTFLSGDLESPRFRERLLALLRADRVHASLVAEPDLADTEANAYRRALLARHHEWLAGPHVFGSFPEGLRWSRAALTPDEVLAIRYIDWDWWLRISGGSRSPVEAAKRLRNGEVPGGSAEEHEPIARRLGSSNPPPALIVVGPANLARLVVIEGHVRLTAYALFPELLPEELEVLLGVSDEIEQWSLF